MKKKFVITGITVLLFLMAGICYSCNFKEDNASVLVTSLKDDSTSASGEPTQSGTGIGEQTPDGNIKISAAGENSETKSSLDNAQPENKAAGQAADSSKETTIYVHLCGAVINPGVYKADAGARLFDLIELAGGLNEAAADDYINQAQTVTDGQRIYIPTRDELKELSLSEYIDGDKGNREASSDNASSDSIKLVNINKAGAEELMNLPGIGQSKADSILSYREANGNFKAIEDLMNISGIKEGLFNQISSYITIN